MVLADFQVVFFLPVSFGGESEGTPESLSVQKYGIILVWSGSGPQILSGLSSPAKSLKIDARLPEKSKESESIQSMSRQSCVRSALQPASGHEPPGVSRLMQLVDSDVLAGS